MDNATAEARPQPVNTTGVQTYGQIFVGLDATPTGSDMADDAVADFTGATVTRRASQATPPASTAGSEPWLHTPSQTDGSMFQATARARGLWRVTFVVVHTGAASASVGLNVDGVAADFDSASAPIVPDGDRNPDVKRITNLAGAAIAIEVSTHVAVREGDRPTVRGLLTNLSGGNINAANLVLPAAYMRFDFVRDVP